MELNMTEIIDQVVYGCGILVLFSVCMYAFAHCLLTFTYACKEFWKGLILAKRNTREWIALEAIRRRQARGLKNEH